jgi:hypothetical protein
VLYSVGSDRHDDGGTANPEDPNSALPTGYGPPPANWKYDPADSRGDYILWPPIREKEPEETEEPDHRGLMPPPSAPGS